MHENERIPLESLKRMTAQTKLIPWGKVLIEKLLVRPDIQETH